MAWIAGVPSATMASTRDCIEAGMATHYVARELLALGHDVRQVPPAYAKPFRQCHKNDFRDAHAIAEAVQRPSTRCVSVKTEDQLDLQALHRVRSRLVGQRTAVINQIRSFLLERGIAVRQGLTAVFKLIGLLGSEIVRDDDLLNHGAFDHCLRQFLLKYRADVF